MAVSEPGELEEDVRATDGRVPGRRGIATRRRLLDCAAELLTKTSYRDIKVIDIAREAGTSPATFYQYFPDVEQAVLVLAEELAGDAAYLAELVRSDWRGDRGAQTARRIVESFLEYYDRHRAVFRVVDLATESIMLELTGSSSKIEGLIQVLRESGYEILEVSRTGRMAMRRGHHTSLRDLGLI